MERMVSPGVFTRENDQSFLAQGIAEIGAAFVGPTQKGPAFRPIIVESQEDYERIFGGTSPDYYTPTAVHKNRKKPSDKHLLTYSISLSGELSIHSEYFITSSNTGCG